MNNSIKRYAGFILCAFTMLLGSCSQNPFDKKIDEMEAFVMRMDKIAHEQNPSNAELISLKKDAFKFTSSMELFTANNPQLQGIKATAIQKKRVFDAMMKMDRLETDPNFQRIKARLRVIDSNH